VLVDAFVSHAMRDADALQTLDSKLRGSATEMMQRVTREMLDRPYYHGSLFMSRANSQR
jgi:hypothetical protein